MGLLLAAAVVAACGGASDADGSADGAATEPTEEPGTPDAAGETRTVTTVAGDVEVPVAPERIVTTHNIATQPLIDLGVEPIAIGDLPEEAAYPDYWEAIADLPQVGNGLEPDIERIVGLEPDLIFAINQTPPEALDQLAQIAPTVVIGIEGPQRADWQGRAELVAEVTGREAELEQLGVDYAERAETIATTYADTLAEETFVVLESFEPGTVVPYGPNSMVGEVLEPAGMTFAPSASSDLVAAIDEDPSASVSLERLPEVTDGSVILHGALAATAEPGPVQQEVLDSPLLLASDAAEAGRIYPIGKTLIAGYGDAFAALDLFEAALQDLAGG